MRSLLRAPLSALFVMAMSAPIACAPPGATEPLGAGALALSGDPSVTASFVSSRGWVAPGESYVFKVRYSSGNALLSASTLKIALPPSAELLVSTPAASSGSGTEADPLVYSLGALAPNTTGQILIEAKAKSLAEDPEIIWKDLSATASFEGSVLGVPQPVSTSKTHGPRVTTLESARYGDRPFPMINVQYQDVKHCTGAGTPFPECTGAHTAEGLDEAVNSRTTGTSLYQLYQEITLGQLFPEGRVPSAGKGTVPFSGVGQHKWSTPKPSGLCTGTTLGGLDGSLLYLNRIEDGWYTLPGTQAYYGADSTGHNLAAALTGQGLVSGIDNACGPTGKLVYDAASIADPDLDYNEFDTDRDGVVDFFMAIFAGDGGNGTTTATGLNNIWPHSSDLRYYFTDANGETGYLSRDQRRDHKEQPLWWTDASRTATTTADQGEALKAFVRVGPYNVNPEPSQEKISVIAHEYGHSLGLPDFYSLGSRQTFGSFELMASDHAQLMTAYARQKLGWVVPRELTDGTVTLVESKLDTHEITWRRPDATPYTLSGPDVHNADVYRVGMPTEPLIEEAASGTHAWYSGAGNDFGCPPDEGHGLVVQLPEVAQLGGATAISLKLKSYYEMEWDFDYGFVLASVDGGDTWQSLASKNSTTLSGHNPNQNACLATYGNGITGVSGEPNTLLNVNRLMGTYPASVWFNDEFDLTPYKGKELLVMFSYATDPGLAKRGWFIDDIEVSATSGGETKPIYASDFEESDEPTRLFPAGVAGFSRITSDQGVPADHAYYIELRDRVSWDYDGNAQSDRGPPTWEPGVSIVYSNEAHGYGNVGVDSPPAQTPVDAVPTPGSETPNLDDAAFTAAPGRNKFDGCTHIDNYTDPAGPNGQWKLPAGVSLVVSSLSGLSMTGEGPSAATATLVVDVAPDCSLPPKMPPELSFGPDQSDPDPDGSYTLQWTRPAGAVGPDLLQETTSLAVLLSDGAEGGLGAWTTSTSGTGALAWEVSPGKVQSGMSAFWARALDGVMSASSVLELTAPINVPAAGVTTLSFFDWLAAEGDDKAFVEIIEEPKTAGDAAYEVTRGLLLNEAALALATEPMTKRVIDLTPYAGKTIHLRFHFTVGAEDRPGSSPSFGWYVDDISIDTADWQDVITTPQTSHLRDGLSSGTYFYRVRSAYPFGATLDPGPWSNIVTTAVDPTMGAGGAGGMGGMGGAASGTGGGNGTGGGSGGNGTGGDGTGGGGESGVGGSGGSGAGGSSGIGGGSGSGTGGSSNTGTGGRDSSASSGTGGDFFDGDVTASGGCACSTPGEAPASPPPHLLGLALAWLLRRRRRAAR